MLNLNKSYIIKLVIKMDYKLLPQYTQDFLSYLEIKNLSKNTIKNYYYDLISFTSFLKEYKHDVSIDALKSLELLDLYTYCIKLKDKGNSNNSRRRKIACLRVFFKYLHDKAKIINSNPTSELEYPKLTDHKPIYLSLEESKSLLQSISGENYSRDIAMINIFLNCGLRLSEIISLNIYSIKNDYMNVIGKGDTERIIPLNQVCVNVISNYMAVRLTIKTNSIALFLSRRKQRMSEDTVQNIVKKYIKASGLDTDLYSTHKLRHTCATLMYKYGNVDIKILQEILGHKNISTTKVYTHTDNEDIRKAMNNHPLADL